MQYKIALALAGLAIAILVTVQFMPASNADAQQQDYTVVQHPQPRGIGSAGATVYNYSTPLAVSNAVSLWSGWAGIGTSTIRYSAASEATGCGGAVEVCVIYVNAGSSVVVNSTTVCQFWNTDTQQWQSTAPAHSGQWGRTYTDHPMHQNVDCGGSESNPIWVITYEGNHTATERLHIARHELGHAMDLDDAPDTVGCWVDGSVYPLMKNSAVNCPAFGENVIATTNEINAAITWNGW